MRGKNIYTVVWKVNVEVHHEPPTDSNEFTYSGMGFIFSIDCSSSSTALSASRAHVGLAAATLLPTSTDDSMVTFFIHSRRDDVECLMGAAADVQAEAIAKYDSHRERESRREPFMVVSSCRYCSLNLELSNCVVSAKTKQTLG